MKKFFLIAVTLFVAVEMAYAYNNTYALVVGIADYKNSNDLTYTVSDTKMFANFLASKKGGKVPVGNIVLLVNNGATKANIMAYAKSLFSKAGKDDRVIFYFSGHGGSGFFAPYDCGDSWDSYLYYDEVKAMFRNAKCSTKLLFADACCAGGMKEKNEYVEMTEEKRQALSNSNIAVMMSCKADECSIETPSLRHGIFTYYLIEGLSGNANSDKSSYVTIKELFYHVYKKTKAYSEKQTPQLFGKFNPNLIVGKI